MNGRGRVAALAAAALAVTGCGAATAPSRTTDAASAALGLPPPTRGGLPVGRPHELVRAASGASTTWASVRRTTAARTAPGTAARPAGVVLTARTPEATTNIVPVLARRRVGRSLWVRVGLPALPNGRTGWVPRATLGAYGSTEERLVVDRRALTATLLRAGRVVFRAPVGIGVAAAPTPAGRFLVRNVLRRYRSRFYGPIAFGTSARSATLTDWPGGGYIGIHGTDEPELIPGRVSHGCIRMRNRDIVSLARLLRPGTPLTIS